MNGLFQAVDAYQANNDKKNRKKRTHKCGI